MSIQATLKALGDAFNLIKNQPNNSQQEIGVVEQLGGMIKTLGGSGPVVQSPTPTPTPTPTPAPAPVQTPPDRQFTPSNKGGVDKLQPPSPLGGYDKNNSPGSEPRAK